MILILNELAITHHVTSNMKSTALHILFSISLIWCQSIAFGQAKAKLAETHFNRLEYFQAAPIYAELANKSINGKTKQPQWDHVRKAAYTYKQLFQYNQSKYYYAKLHDANQLTEQDYIEYIDILRTIGKYDVAEDLLADAYRVYPNNNFVVTLKERNAQFGHLLQDSARYAIEALTINSGKGDFCPTFFEAGLLYMSKAKNAGFLNTKYSWDNAYFINMLYASYDIDSTLKEGQVIKDAFFSRAHDGPVSFSPDGNTMVITKNTLGKHKKDTLVVLALYFSQKVNGEWKELTPFPFNNPNYNVGHACWANDGKRIYFASDAPGGRGEADLYYSDLIGGKWSQPVNLGPTINTEQDDLFPFVLNDMLYFSSNGHFGIGGLDVFQVNLTNPGTVNNMGYPMNTSYDDFGIIALPGNKSGFFSSNRGDFVDRIYSWKLQDPKITFQGNLFALFEEKQAMGNHAVIIKDITSGEIDTLKTNEKGEFTTTISFRHAYHMIAEENYFKLTKDISFNTSNIGRDTTINDSIFLKPTHILVKLKVVEKGTDKIIPLAKVDIRNSNTGEEVSMFTDSLGMIEMQVPRWANYIAHASKKRYVDGEANFNTTDENNKVITLLLELPPIRRGDIFTLENIFYDYNKASLRPESTASLDKLAAFIMENNVKIELSSHTDARGTDSYNMKLSQARAQSCVDYLLKKGVPKANIIAKGYGETKLLNRCKNGIVCSEEEHQANRRTEIKIL